MQATQEKITIPQLKKEINSFIRNNNEEEIKSELSKISNFDEVLEKMRRSFANSHSRSLAKERAKEIIQGQKNLAILLEWREKCSHKEEDVSSLRGCIETTWEKVWKLNFQESPEQNLLFLKQIKNINFIPRFAINQINNTITYM